MNDRLILSVGMDFHDSRIHSTIRFQGDAFKLPSLVSLCIPSSASHWSYFSVHIALKSLFYEISGAWINFVHPPVIKAWSIFEDVNDAATLLSIWHLYESHAKNLLPKEKVPRTFLVHSVVKPLFIQTIDEVTITHLVLNSSLRVFVSRFAFLNTRNGFNFDPSAFAVKHTDTRHFSWPVDFIVTVRAPVSSTVVSETIFNQTGV